LKATQKEALTGLRLLKRHDSVSGFSGRLKRALDVTVSIAALIVLSPLLLFLALVIRLMDGRPVFYRQTRVGLNGRHFTMLKFRSMIPGAEDHLGAVWAVPNDPRCTRLGALLRRLGLDELPQLFNVIRGDMSLVGPRPERPEFTREFAREHRQYPARHLVRGGITGYAQVHGWRGYTSLEDRLRHDLYYVKNWSLRLDLYILALTLSQGWSERTRRGM
jgi:exopolysaccharide biosynthesis polyprenyl glycosylphosphotransferase